MVEGVQQGPVLVGTFFKSELHLLHQLEHCTKGQIKVATSFCAKITYAWFW